MGMEGVLQQCHSLWNPFEMQDKNYIMINHRKLFMNRCQLTSSSVSLVEGKELETLWLTKEFLKTAVIRGFRFLNTDTSN